MSAGIDLTQAVVREEIQTYVVRLDTGVTESGGRATKNIQQTVSRDLAIFRLGFRDLMTLPQGQYNQEDIKAYELGAKTITMESVIVFEGSEFRVVSNSDRNKDGGFTMYIAQKVGDNETSTE